MRLSFSCSIYQNKIRVEPAPTIKEVEENLDYMIAHNMNINGGENLKPNSTKEESTREASSFFKSANWLSDSELIFSLTNQVGGLVRALRIFQELDIGIKHVESRKSKRRDSEFEIFVDIDCSDQEKMKKLVHHLRHEVNCLTKEEFERWSKSPQLVRQNSQMQSPLSSSLSFNEVIKPVTDENNQLVEPKEGYADNNINNKALTLMMQPSIDYGQLNFFFSCFCFE